MSDQARLEVEILPPQKGWMHLELRCGENQFVMSASYTPYDSLTELVGALCGLVEDRRPGKARFNAEPEQFDLCFEAIPSTDRARLCVRAYRQGSRRIDSFVEVFAFEAGVAEIGRLFWRAMRKLESRFPAAGSEDWIQQFPSKDLNALGILVSTEDNFHR